MAKRVVIVDDSKFIVGQLSTFFEKQLGIEVVATGIDGNDAVELYRKYQPDLIVLDICMPNKRGYEALEEILDEFPRANILMVSAVRGEEMLKCMSRGAKGYMEKPLRMNNQEFINDFKQTVEEILQGEEE